MLHQEFYETITPRGVIIRIWSPESEGSELKERHKLLFSCYETEFSSLMRKYQIPEIIENTKTYNGYWIEAQSCGLAEHVMFLDRSPKLVKKERER